MLNIKEQIMDKQMHQFIYLDDADKRKNVVDEIKNLDPTNVIILEEFGTKPYKLHENCRKNVFNCLSCFAWLYTRSLSVKDVMP